jgi:hypothetical protein
MTAIRIGVGRVTYLPKFQISRVTTVPIPKYPDSKGIGDKTSSPRCCRYTCNLRPVSSLQYRIDMIHLLTLLLWTWTC